MKLLLFGATGVTGPSVLREALERGHDVRVIARNPAAITTTHDRLEIVKGDATVTADVDAAVAGRDAVVHCLGIGGKGTGKPTTLVSDSIAMLLPIMRAHRVKRLIAMSNVGAGTSGPWVARKLIIPVFLRWLSPIIVDKNRMESILREAGDLEWVAGRFPAIVDGPAKPIRTSPPRRGVGLRITTGSVATWMLDQLGETPLLGTTPSVSN
jgi:putative NADH-flavin reductase